MNRLNELKANIKTVRQENKVLKKAKRALQEEINKLNITADLYNKWKKARVIMHLFKRYYLIITKDEHSAALPRLSDSTSD